MVSKENIKHYILLSIVIILLYKFINNPIQFISGIGGVAKFFSPFLIGILISLLINPLVMLFEIKFNVHRLLSIFISYVFVFYWKLLPFIMSKRKSLSEEIFTLTLLFLI